MLMDKKSEQGFTYKKDVLPVKASYFLVLSYLSPEYPKCTA